MSNRRKSIGVLIDHADYLSAGYETQLRHGFHEACSARSLDLFLFFGRPLEGPGHRGQNRVYELVHPDCVDGIIAVSPGLATYTGEAGVRALLDRWPQLPRCSLGLVLSGIPSIVADNRPGMYALVEHLLDAHGCRRFVFLGGPASNPDALSRYASFQEVLERRGLSHEAALYEEAFFTIPSGAEAMRKVLARGVKFDAVIAASDGIALGASEALRAAGLRVPRDARVTGFDDAPLAQIGTPSLTTVRQPLSAMARLAVELIAASLHGQSVPEQSSLAVEFVPRRSCGCAEPGPHWSIPRLSSPPTETSIASDGEAAVERDERVGRIALHLSPWGSAGQAAAAALVQAGSPAQVLLWLEEWSLEPHPRLAAYDELEQALAELRASAPIEVRREEAWFDVFSLILRQRSHAHARSRVRADVGYWHLLRSGERVLTAFELSEVAEILGYELPRMGISRAQISLFVDEDRRDLESFLCLQEGRVVSMAAERYPVTQLLPFLERPRSLQRPESAVYFVWPLATETENFGVFVVQVDPAAAPHEMLREHVSAALKSVKLQREIVETTAAHERSTQERLATARRMHALNVLAGGVAHDLNNSLGPLVGLPDVILREIEQAAGGRSSMHEVRTDIATIKTAALRASQTIKDLLTSARQGRTSKESLELNRLVTACVQQERSQSAPAESARPGRIEFTQQLCPEALFVRASEAHLVRAISNLIRNAVEAIDGHGRVSVSTRSVVLHEALAGYETITPGAYAVVSVEDTGRGIPAVELGRVFEPFFSKKRTGEHSGSGLGLAIVHGVVKEHGGFLDVESTPGAGTRFTLYFERTRESVRPEEPAPSLRASKCRILVVDDDALQLRTAARVLSHQGHEITTEISGRQAYRRFEDAHGHARGSPFDLLILDVQLGEELDGLAVLERVQRLYPDQRAVMVSGHAVLEGAANSASRFVAWLPKPYTMDQLGRSVQAALSENILSKQR